MTKTCASEPWHALSRRDRRLDRAGAPGGNRGDPGDHRPRGPRVRPPARGCLWGGNQDRGERGPASVRRADSRPRGGQGPRPRRLRRAGPRGAPRGPDPRLAAVRLPRRRACRLAPDLGGRRRRASTPSSSACCRGDLRLHRRALRRLRRGLCPGPARAGGRAPAPPPRAARAAAPRPAGRRRGVRAAAQAAGWRLPRRAAALAVAEADLARLARRLPADALVASVGGIGCALVSAPDRGELERATRKLTAALGPAVPRAELAGSWALAAAALRAAEAGAIDAAGLIEAEDTCRAAALRVGRPGAAPRGAQARPARRAHRGGPGADGGDGARLRPARRERRRDGEGAPPPPADGPLPARAAAGALRRRPVRPRRPLRARAGAQVPFGSHSANFRLTTAPPSDAFVALALPSCSSATRCTIARPSPSSVCRARRRRARSGRRPCRGPWGKPGPWSRTVTLPP